MQQQITPEDLALVRAIHAETGILTVKDQNTEALAKEAAKGRGDHAHPGFPGATPYGVRFHPVMDERANPPTRDPNVQWERTVIRELDGSPRWPEGIPIGGYTVWNRNTPLDIPFGDKDFKAVTFRRDISGAEFNRLRTLSQNRVYLTDEDKKRIEEENIRRLQGAADSQRDPIGAVGRAFGPGLAEAIGEAVAVGIAAATGGDVEGVRNARKGRKKAETPAS